MYNEELEQLIEAALADGVLTDKEKKVLFKKAESLGVDHDEFEMVLDARLTKAQAQRRPSNEKLGNIAICPNCGAQIKGGLAVCPECGYEFRNVEGNQSVKKFSDGLESIQEKAHQQRMSIPAKNHLIENYFTTFPVPNTAEDLLEFLSFVEGPAKKHDRTSFFDSLDSIRYMEQAYWNLYSKCITKAKINFANDPRFVPFYEHYDAARKKWTPEASAKFKYLLVCVIWFAILIIIGVVMSK